MAEKADFGEDWKFQEYTPKEWDVKSGKPRPIKSWVDPYKASEDYRTGWDRIFGKKSLTKEG